MLAIGHSHGCPQEPNGSLCQVLGAVPRGPPGTPERSLSSSVSVSPLPLSLFHIPTPSWPFALPSSDNPLNISSLFCGVISQRYTLADNSNSKLRLLWPQGRLPATILSWPATHRYSLFSSFLMVVQCPTVLHTISQHPGESHLKALAPVISSVLRTLPPSGHCSNRFFLFFFFPPWSRQPVSLTFPDPLPISLALGSTTNPGVASSQKDSLVLLPPPPHDWLSACTFNNCAPPGGRSTPATTPTPPIKVYLHLCPRNDGGS